MKKKINKKTNKSLKEKNKKLRERNLKKIYVALIISVIILIVGLILMVIFLPRKSDEFELTINSSEVVELYDKVNDVYVCQNNLTFDPFKDNNKVTIDEIDQDLIPLLVFRQLELDGKFDYSKEIIISVDEFEQTAKKLFGYVPKYEISKYDYQLLEFEKDGSNYIGKLTSVECEEKYPIKKSKLVGLEEEDNQLILIVDIYKIDEKHDDIDKYIDTNSDKLRIDTYRYIFEKDNGNYYLKRIER